MIEALFYFQQDKNCNFYIYHMPKNASKIFCNYFLWILFYAEMANLEGEKH